MKPTITILGHTMHPITRLAAVATLAFAGVARAQPADWKLTYTPPEQRNAALAYWRVIGTVDNAVFQKARDVDMSKAPTQAAGEGDDAFKAACAAAAENQSAILDIVRASRLAKCDFETSYESGFDALLPHLGKMRDAVRLLRVDARRLALEGKRDDAAIRLAAMFRMAGQLSKEQLLINSLVAVAVSSVAAEEGKVLLSMGAIGENPRAEMLDACKSLLGEDPFGMRADIRGEALVMKQWFDKNLANATDAKEFVRKLTAATGNEDGSPSRAMQSMEIATIRAQLARAIQYYVDVDAAWTKPDSTEQLAALEKKVSAGEYGTVAQVVGAAFTKAHQSAAKGAANVREFIALLEKPAAR